VISSDQYNLYRSNGVQRSTTSGAAGSLCDLGVNVRGDNSDWAVSEVLLYDRELSLSEIEEVEVYLEAWTSYPTSVPTVFV
jgi:hypothetical protein